MISLLRYTLLGDGTSDRALMPVLRWLLLQSGTPLPLSESWADPRRLQAKTNKLTDRLPKALELYPCDLLFVHRDAEKESAAVRHSEIAEALDYLRLATPTIAVVPVRMTEAWLLLDEAAIRQAAGNPNGRVRLGIPNVKELETLPDPKEKLNEALRAACELGGRRLAQFRRDEALRRVRVADLVEDYSSLRHLASFVRFQQDTYSTLEAQGWLA